MGCVEDAERLAPEGAQQQLQADGHVCHVRDRGDDEARVRLEERHRLPQDAGRVSEALEDVGEHYDVEAPPVELLDPVRLLDVPDDDLLAVCPRAGRVLGIALDADDAAASGAQDLGQVAMRTTDVEDRAIMSHEPDDLGDGGVLVREVGGEMAVLGHARWDPTPSRFGRHLTARGP